MEPWEVAGRAAIAELNGGYARDIDGGDLEGVADRFARDGVLVVHGGRAYRKRTGILEFLTVSRRARERSGQGLAVRHHVSSLTVGFTGPDSAQSTSYFLAMGASGPDHWGRYDDVLLVEDGAWRFASRAVTIEGADPRGWIGSGGGAVTFDPPAP
jgi:hypothetical protein